LWFSCPHLFFFFFIFSLINLIFDDYLDHSFVPFSVRWMTPNFYLTVRPEI
jgi:hypothetical protein